MKLSKKIRREIKELEQLLGVKKKNTLWGSTKRALNEHETDKKLTEIVGALHDIEIQLKRFSLAAKSLTNAPGCDLQSKKSQMVRKNLLSPRVKSKYQTLHRQLEALQGIVVLYHQLRVLDGYYKQAKQLEAQSQTSAVKQQLSEISRACFPNQQVNTAPPKRRHTWFAPTSASKNTRLPRRNSAASTSFFGLFTKGSESNSAASSTSASRDASVERECKESKATGRQSKGSLASFEHQLKLQAPPALDTNASVSRQAPVTFGTPHEANRNSCP